MFNIPYFITHYEEFKEILKRVDAKKEELRIAAQEKSAAEEQKNIIKPEENSEITKKLYVQE